MIDGHQRPGTDLVIASVFLSMSGRWRAGMGRTLGVRKMLVVLERCLQGW